MLALTLIDDNRYNPVPWASLMHAQFKTIESRKWWWPIKTKPLPVDLLLMASKSSRTDFAGKAVCVVQVYANHVFSYEHQQEACCPIYPGFGFHTRNLRWLSSNFPVSGRQGLFDVPIPDDVKLFTPLPEQIHLAQYNLIQAYPDQFNEDGTFNWQRLRSSMK